MRCKKCGADVPDTAAFCTACGAAVEKEDEGVRCKNCGAVIPEGAAFCPACGTAREKEPEVVHCKNCGAVIPDGAAFCMACGTAREKQPEVIYCKNCGAVIPDGAAFCTACGTPKEPAQAPDVHCAHCGAVIPDGAAFCTACGTPKGAAAPAAQAPVNAPSAVKKNAAQTMDKTGRRLNLVGWVCLVLGFLLSWVGSYVSDAGASDYESLIELSNTVAMYNALSLLMFLVAIILFIIQYIRNKKNQNKP